MLPYADLVLFTATSSLSVVYGVFLAIVILGERLVPKYDLIAMFFILFGCVLTVMQCNFTQTTYSAKTVIELITGFQSIVFLTISFVIFALTFYAVQR